jgi:hypothetical protein
MDNYWNSETCQCPPKMERGDFLTDLRTPARRELYNMYINGIQRDDDMRTFYQQNAEKIMDSEWDYLKRTQSCFTNSCLHQNPTRSSPSADYNEMRLYNDVRTNKIRKNDPKFPICPKLKDYRMTMTPNSLF